MFPLSSFDSRKRAETAGERQLEEKVMDIDLIVQVDDELPLQRHPQGPQNPLINLKLLQVFLFSIEI